MKIEPKVVKSIRENSGDIAILYSLGSILFMVEERVTEVTCSETYTIVNQSF